MERLAGDVDVLRRADEWASSAPHPSLRPVRHSPPLGLLTSAMLCSVMATSLAVNSPSGFPSGLTFLWGSSMARCAAWTCFATGAGGAYAGGAGSTEVLATGASSLSDSGSAWLKSASLNVRAERKLSDEEAEAVEVTRSRGEPDGAGPAGVGLGSVGGGAGVGGEGCLIGSGSVAKPFDTSGELCAVDVAVVVAVW